MTQPENVAGVFAPILVFDSREKWFPVGVEESVGLYGFEWVNGGWERKLADGTQRDRLDLPDGMRQPGLPPVGYHRVREGGGLH